MEIKTREQTVYVASDGKEFTSEGDCKLHEQDLADRAEWNEDLDVASKLEWFSLTPSMLDFDPDLNWTWYYVSTPEELASLRTKCDCWYSSSFSPSREDILEQNESLIPLLPDWVAVEEWDDVASIVGTSTQALKGLQSFLTKLKTQMDVIKKG